MSGPTRIHLRLAMMFLFFPSSLVLATPVPCEPSSYQAGASHGDITGPVAEIGMMGYAEPSQISRGLHMRLWSRAIVIQDNCSARPVALVTNDMGMIFYELKRAILKSLAESLPGVFDDHNLLLSATHTHAGPGGYAHHALYQFTTLGFHPDVFEAVRQGTVNAILRAYKSRIPARLSLTDGELDGIQFNRSLDAYEKNPAKERQLYRRDHDPKMVLLAITGENGEPIASLNWFGIHPVSLPMENKLISGDNKGLAAYLVEQAMGTTYEKEREFVAAFAQESAGDISPYALSPEEKVDKDGFERNRLAAHAQASKALELFRAPGRILTGPVASIHQFVKLQHRSVSLVENELFTYGKTCLGSLGFSFAAGTENGQPLKIFKEGTVYGVNWPRFTLLPREQRCQKEKVVLLPTGLMKPWPWTSDIAPFQIARIGPLAILAAPFEVTTMAGRRLRQKLGDMLRESGIDTVVVQSLANDYLHYVTTREEYAQQSYEGGSNLFGPWSLEAFTDVFLGLGHALSGEKAPLDEGIPADLSRFQLVLKKTPAFDSLPSPSVWGGIKTPPRHRYQPGEEAQATFFCAHPNRHWRSGQSFLQVIAESDTNSLTVRHDWDDDTTFVWHGLDKKPDAFLCSVKWQIPQSITPGFYRICHQGTAKPRLGTDASYKGCTDRFLVAPL